MRIDVDKMLMQRDGKRRPWWSILLTISLLLAASYGIGYLIGALIRIC